MRTFLNRMSDFFEAIPDTVRRRRAWVWTGFILIAIGYGCGALRFELDLSDERFFSDDDPVIIAFNTFRAQFGGDESVYIVYEPKDGDVFSQASLRAVRGLQEDLLNYRLHLDPEVSSALDHIIDVKTIVNANYLEASDDALISRQFIGEAIPTNAAQSNQLRQTALTHPDYPLLYTSAQGNYGGILIRTDFKSILITDESATDTTMKNGTVEDATDFDMDLAFDVTNTNNNINPTHSDSVQPPKFASVDIQDYTDLMHAIQPILEKPEYQAALTFHPVGTPVINTFIMDTLFQQINTVLGLSVILVILALWALFRSLSAILWPTLIIAVAAILTVATLGWLDLRMNMMVMITILLILVVGVADSVHLLSGYNYFRHHKKNHVEALRAAYRQAGMAILLTSITTALGMLSLLFVPIELIQIFGISAALGVLFAFVISIIMLPLMLDIWRPFSEKRAQLVANDNAKLPIIQQLLRKVETLSYAKPALNVSIFSVITLVFLFGITYIEVDSNPMSLFKQDSDIVTTYKLVDEHMGGTQNVEIMIDLGQENGFKDPQVLNAIDAMQRWLMTELPDVVVRTSSLVNIVKNSNQSLNGGRDAAYIIPQDPHVLEQTLFLFNNANPRDRRLVVSDDYSQAHISVNTVNVGSKRYVAILEQIKPEVARLFEPLQTTYPTLKTTVTGSITIFSYLLETLSWSQIKGFGAALAAISIILLIVFGSWKLGMIALYPNLFPLIIMFGLMGYMGIPLDVDTLIVAPLMIGIVVDNTIHFINHYRSEVQQHGNIIRGIQVSFREVGQAITFTSIILSLAFITFLGLDHQGLKNFGILSSVAIASALIAELFLLPALLVLLKVDLQKSTKTNPAKPAIAEV